MSYYRVCECGAFLDPGEICEECKEKAALVVAGPKAAREYPSTPNITSF